MKRAVYAAIIVIAILAEAAWMCMLAGIAWLAKDANPVEIIATLVTTNLLVLLAVSAAVVQLAELLGKKDEDPFGGAR